MYQTTKQQKQMSNINFNNVDNSKLGQNATAAPLFAARRNRPEGGYEIPAQVAEWVSDESLDVLQYFGLEAADLLNKYSNALEDALISQVQRCKELEAELEAYRSAARGDISL